MRCGFYCEKKKKEKKKNRKGKGKEKEKCCSFLTLFASPLLLPSETWNYW